jgi:predicted acylesterase/phospholipase RssA
MTVGIVLGGGGARGDFEVGVLRFLYDKVFRTTGPQPDPGNNIIAVLSPPEIICGTSAGAINAVAVAIEGGRSSQLLERLWLNMRQNSDMYLEESWFTKLPQEIRELMTYSLGQIAKDFALSFVIFPPWGLYKLIKKIFEIKDTIDEVKKLIDEASKARFIFSLNPLKEKLDSITDLNTLVERSGVKLRISTVSLETGELRYITEKGVLLERDNKTPVNKPHETWNIVDAVLASAAQPGIFPPVEMYGNTYVDGGVRENLPLQAAIDLGADHIIAIATSTALAPKESEQFKDIVSIANRAVLDIMMDEGFINDAEAAKFSDATVILIRPTILVHDGLTIDPGLIRISLAYGYMCAADTIEVPSEKRGELRSFSDRMTNLRKQVWEKEEFIPISINSSDHDVIRGLKREIRRFVENRWEKGAAVPSDIEKAWMNWEEHSMWKENILGISFMPLIRTDPKLADKIVKVTEELLPDVLPPGNLTAPEIDSHRVRLKHRILLWWNKWSVEMAKNHITPWHEWRNAKDNVLRNAKGVLVKAAEKPYGILIKERDKPETYVIYGGAKLQVSPPEASFNAMGYSRSDVRIVPAGTADLTPNIPVDGTLLKEKSDFVVYIVKEGMRHSVSNMKAYHFSWGNVREVPDGALSKIPIGEPYRAWLDEQDLGGILTSGPAVASWGPNRLDVFCRGQNGRLLQKVSDSGGNTWTGWHEILPKGGVIDPGTDPAAVSPAVNNINVVYRGQNKHPKGTWWDNVNQNWTPEEEHPGILTSSPALSSWGGHRLDSFYKGQNNHLWHQSYDESRNELMSGEKDIGGLLTSSPDAVSWGNNRIDVVYRGQNGRLWHRFSDNGGDTWAGEHEIRGVIDQGSDPTICSQGPNRLDVFYRGQNKHLKYRWTDDGGKTWSTEEDLGGILNSSPAAVSWGYGRVDVFYRGQNNHLWQRTFG